jgi:cardiolipin synthase
MKFFTSPQGTWDNMYHDIADAKKSVFFEQFIFEDFEKGEIGQRFANLFIQKAQDGVKVQLLLDIFGSYRFFFSPTRKILRGAGVEIHFTALYLKHFLTLSFWKTRRNHRKLTIIDEKIVYIGGVVFTKDVANWHDFHARIYNPSAIFTHEFFLSKTSKKVDKLLQTNTSEAEVEAKVEAEVEAEVYSVATNDFKRRHLSEEIYEKIISAQKSILIITPYFAPPKKFILALIAATERGVPVTIMFPEDTDNYFAQNAHHYYVHSLRKTSLCFQFFKKMNHAKVIIIDDWTTFGSCNFDHLSLMYNKELNVTTSDAELTQEIQRVLQPIIKQAEPTIQSLFMSENIVVKIKRILIGSFVRFFV